MKGKNTLNWRREKANGKKKIFFFELLKTKKRISITSFTRRLQSLLFIRLKQAASFWWNINKSNE